MKIKDMQAVARDHKESRKNVLEVKVHIGLYYLRRRRISYIRHVLALLRHHQISVIVKVFSENYM
jgi:hypothetical protein